MKKFLWTLLFAAFMMPMAAHAQCTDGTPCQFTIYGEDTWGDGWEGSLTIYRNNTQMATFEVDEDDSTAVYTVCAGDQIRIMWSGSDQYGENFFTISCNGITYVSNAAGATYAPSGMVVEFTACATCLPVTNLTISGVSSYGATLTWSDASNSGATYTIYNMADTSIEASYVTGTTYTFTSLDAGTAYTFAIVANCSATDESSMTYVSFNTLCESFDLPISESFADTSSTFLCWNFVSGNDANVGGTNGAGLNTVNGNSVFRFSSYSSASDYNQYLYSPVFDVTSAATGVLVNVRYATYGSSDNLYFGYVTATDTVWDSVAYNTTGSSDWQVYSAPLPVDAQRLAIRYYGSYAYYAWIDSVSISEMAGSFCHPISNLVADSITPYSAIITWSDANNSGASYTIINTADSTVIDSYVSDTVYTLENLNPNTLYTVAVVTECSDGGQSAATTVTFRTGCAPQPLPFVENFDVTLSGNPCWRGASGTTAAEVFAGTALNLVGLSAWTYATSTSNGLDAGHYRVNIYGSSCKRWMITPEIDLSSATNPILTFDAAFTAYSSAAPASGYNDNSTQAFMVIVSTDGGQTWDSASAVRWQNAGGQHTLAEIAGTGYVNQMVDLSQYAGDTICIAFYAQSTTSGGDNNLHIDNILVDEAPSCFPVAGLTASNITDNSVTLTWNDTVNSGATYTVYNMADTSIVAANLSDTSYTATGLTANTSYTFGVEVNCSASDVARIITVSFRTDCGAETLPFTEDFSTSLSSDPCWRGASNATAAQVFAGTALTLGTPSNWSYTSSDRCGLSGGHYYKNVYGSSVKSWMITPAIDLSTVSAAQLSFDVALTDYANAALPDANGDTNTSQAFMVIVSTDGGNTWDSTNATIWQNVGGDYTYASLASLTYQNKVIDLSQYAGDTIKIAFYTQSLWSGGDNDLHIDNIAVTEVADTTNPVLDSFVVVLGVNDATMGTTTPAPGTYAFHLGETAAAMAVANTGYHFVRWEQVIGSFVDTTVANPATHVIDSTMLGLTMTMTAIFAADSTVDTGSYYYLTVNYDTTMGDVFYVDGPYEAGDSAFVMAMPNPGYRFVNWTEGTTVVSTNSFYEFVMNADLTLTANFEVDSTSSADSLTIITAVNDATMGSITPAPGTHRYGEGDVFTVTATPNSGYFFEGWIVSMDYGFFTYTDTLIGMPNTYSDSVDDSYLGMVISFTALFTADSVPVVNPDSIIVTFAVNDATMGTINPAPGTYTYAETDSIHVVATPNDGYYFIGWHIEASYYGYPVDTLIYTNENFFDESFEDMGGMVLTLTALFSADTNTTMYTVSVTANNSTMGTVSGGGVYAEGATVTITATPNTGYTFQGWVIDGDTIAANPYTFTVTGNVNAVAVFVAGTGIDDADMTNVSVYSAESRIFVRGAEGMDVYVYDLNGRTVSSQRNAADAIEFRMAHTGVYLVKVGTAAAKRVLVVR